MAEAKRSDEQSRNDLVANAEQRHSIEHRMAERDRGRPGDDVAAEQRQFHARLPLGDPVAHRRRAARYLAVAPTSRAKIFICSG